jgi:hypothetical protein
MDSPKPTGRIGEILTRCGFVKPEQLEPALELARRENLRLGEALVRLGFLDEDRLTWALGVQFELSYVDLSEDMIDWPLLLSLPLERLRELQLLPMALVDGAIHAVIADPLKAGLASALEELFRHKNVVVQLASAAAIETMLDSAARKKALGLTSATRQADSSSKTFLAQALEAMASGGVDRVVVAPDPGGECAYRVVSASEEGMQEGALLEEEAACFFREMSGDTGGAGLFHEVVSALWPMSAKGAGRAIRGTALSGPLGRVGLLEAIPLHPPKLSCCRLRIFTGADPTIIKSAIFCEVPRMSAAGRAEAQPESSEPSAPPPPPTALECRVDWVAREWLQVEVGDAAGRILACRRLLAGLRPRWMLLEIESLEELARIPTESFGDTQTTLFVIARRPLVGAGIEEILPETLYHEIPRQPEAALRTLRTLLEEE